MSLLLTGRDETVASSMARDKGERTVLLIVSVPAEMIGWKREPVGARVKGRWTKQRCRRQRQHGRMLRDRPSGAPTQCPRTLPIVGKRASVRFFGCVTLAVPTQYSGLNPLAALIISDRGFGRWEKTDWAEEGNVQ